MTEESATKKPAVGVEKLGALRQRGWLDVENGDLWQRLATNVTFMKLN